MAGSGQTPRSTSTINLEWLRTTHVLRHTRCRRTADRGGLRIEDRGRRGVHTVYSTLHVRWVASATTRPSGTGQEWSGKALEYITGPLFHASHTRPGGPKRRGISIVRHSRVELSIVLFPKYGGEVYRGNPRSSRTWIPHHRHRASGSTALRPTGTGREMGTRGFGGPCHRGWRPGDLSHQGGRDRRVFRTSWELDRGHLRWSHREQAEDDTGHGGVSGPGS